MSGLSGRKPIVIVEIDQDQCSLEYGVSPCTAAIGFTGTRKCYNTNKTCQDLDNYTLGTLTLRFVEARSDLPKNLGTLIPSLMSVNSRPTEIDLENGIGKRASVSVTIKDHPYHDRLVDKYVDDRNFIPTQQSTFWIKWLARNPYYVGRALRIREGYIGQALDDMQTRHYVIEDISGPDNNHNVKITAKDIFKLADGDRARAPLESTGTLAADISDVETSATLEPAGIGNDEYPSTGVGRLGKELVTFTRSGDALTITRAQHGTEAESHDAGETFQLCIRWDAYPIADALYDLLNDYTEIPNSWLPKSDWDTEAGIWLSTLDLTGTIAEPTGVNDLIIEILKQSMAYMWVDEYEQRIELQALKPPEGTPTTLNDDSHFIADSIDIDLRSADRVSDVYVYYDIINPLTDLNEPSNYRALRGASDTDAQSAEQYNQRRVRRIFARFLNANNGPEAAGLASRMLTRLRDTPKYLTAALDAKDRELRLGEIINVTTRFIVDDTGTPEETRYQIIKRNESEPGHMLTITAQPYPFLGRFAFIAPDATPSYLSASETEKNSYGFISENGGTMSNGDESYKII